MGQKYVATKYIIGELYSNDHNQIAAVITKLLTT